MILAKPSQPYDHQRHSAMKPTSMDQIVLGGWAEVCVGQWKGNRSQLVVGRVMAIIGESMYLRVAVCSARKTGLKKNDVIEVDLKDLFRVVLL